MKAERFRFYHPIQVRYADTDAQGHVFFSNYLTYFDESHAAYLRAIGVPWSRLKELGLDSYHVSAQCDFRGSASFEDMLHVYGQMTRIGNSSYTMDFAIYKAGGDQLIASGQITAVIVSRDTRQPTRVPNEIRKAAAVFEERSWETPI